MGLSLSCLHCCAEADPGRPGREMTQSEQDMDDAYAATELTVGPEAIGQFMQPPSNARAPSRQDGRNPNVLLTDDDRLRPSHRRHDSRQSSQNVAHVHDTGVEQHLGNIDDLSESPTIDSLTVAGSRSNSEEDMIPSADEEGLRGPTTDSLIVYAGSLHNTLEENLIPID